MTACLVPGCSRDTSKGAQGLCGMHYVRQRRTGTLGPATYERPPGRSLEERVFSRLVEDPSTGCWEWQGALRNGYGAVGQGRRVLYVHRWVFEHLVCELPPRLVLDHLCLNRPCANPAHLDPVTRAVNNERGGLQHGNRSAA